MSDFHINDDSDDKLDPLAEPIDEVEVEGVEGEYVGVQEEEEEEVPHTLSMAPGMNPYEIGEEEFA